MFEVNQIPKRSRDVTCRIALVFPEEYPMAANSYALQLLYSIFNSREGTACERFVYPSTQEGRNSRPQSLESGRALAEFDVIAATFQVEADYFRFTWFLLRGNLHLSWKARGLKGGPVVIGGGPAVTANPLPVFHFLDAVVLGDIEPVAGMLLNVFERVSGGKRQESIAELSALPGALTHQNYEGGTRVKVNALTDLDASPHPKVQVVPRELPPAWEKFFPFKRTFLLEVNRGCPNACQFCITGHQRNPFRNRSLRELKAVLDEGLERTPVDRVTLIGSAVNLHPKFEDLLAYTAAMGVRVTVPSLSAGHLTRSMLGVLAGTGLKTLTVAPESSRELRYAVGKRVDDETFLQAFQEAKECGFKHVKMYFLLGLVGEDDTHMTGIADFIGEVAKTFDAPGATRASVNPLVPKANTPLERYVEYYASKEGFSTLRGRFKALGIKLRGLKRPRAVKFNPPDLKQFKLQTYLSLGDYMMHRVIEALGTAPPTLSRFELSARAKRVDLLAYLSKLRTRTPVPWHFVDT
ncbi:MAG: B12-binding domain-containing radical SAM protein [Promethearchaeota archaeon]